MCVSLIQANLFSLGQILQLLLQSFMSSVTSPQDSADSAGVLQLFLETYFMELLGEDGEKSLDGDQQQVKLLVLIPFEYILCPGSPYTTAILLGRTFSSFDGNIYGGDITWSPHQSFLYCAGLCSAHWPW